MILYLIGSIIIGCAMHNGFVTVGLMLICAGLELALDK